jgi:hypothetical protein
VYFQDDCILLDPEGYRVEERSKGIEFPCSRVSSLTRSHENHKDYGGNPEVA